MSFSVMETLVSIQEQIEIVEEDSIESTVNGIRAAIRNSDNSKSLQIKQLIIETILTQMFYSFYKHRTYLHMLFNLISNSDISREEYINLSQNINESSIFANNDLFVPYVSQQILEEKEKDFFHFDDGKESENFDYIFAHDEVNLLTEMSLKPFFDKNMRYKLQNSPYIFSGYSLSLVEIAAFLGAIKCFKYLLLNNCLQGDASYYALAGGNLEIIRLCSQESISFEDHLDAALSFYHYDIMVWIFSQYTIDLSLVTINLKNSLKRKQYRIMTFLFQYIFHCSEESFSLKMKKELVYSLIKSCIKRNDDMALSYFLSFQYPGHIDFEDAPFLCESVAYQNKTAFDMLIKWGKININHQNERSGNTVLHIASILSDTYYFDRLLSLPDINPCITNRVHQAAIDLIKYRSK